MSRRSSHAHCALAALVLVVTGCAGQPAVTYTSAAPSPSAAARSFDQETAGRPPEGSEVFSGEWVVRAEADAPSKPTALCQTGRAEFPAIALTSTVYGDVSVTTRFKPISGRTDQAAGIIFRVQDKDNYYILRANALEDNVNFYIYASGKRSSLKGSSAKVASNVWQELRVEVTGNHFRGFLNGQ